MVKPSPGQFLGQVRQEVRSQVVWPTSKETLVSTLINFLMVTVAAIFFLLVDQALAWSVRQVFGLGG